MSKEIRSHGLDPSLLEELVEVEFPDSSDASFRFTIYMTREVWETYDKLDASWRARCEKNMEFYRRDGPVNLSPDKFRNEGRHHTGGKSGKEIMIYAFKAYQVRVYGGKIPNVDCFICTEIDPAKKQDKADVAKLRRAAQKLGRYL